MGVKLLMHLKMCDAVTNPAEKGKQRRCSKPYKSVRREAVSVGPAPGRSPSSGWAQLEGQRRRARRGRLQREGGVLTGHTAGLLENGDGD